MTVGYAAVNAAFASARAVPKSLASGISQTVIVLVVAACATVLPENATAPRSAVTLMAAIDFARSVRILASINFSRPWRIPRIS